MTGVVQDWNNIEGMGLVARICKKCNPTDVVAPFYSGVGHHIISKFSCRVKPGLPNADDVGFQLHRALADQRQCVSITLEWDEAIDPHYRHGNLLLVDIGPVRLNECFGAQMASFPNAARGTSGIIYMPIPSTTTSSTTYSTSTYI